MKRNILLIINIFKIFQVIECSNLDIYCASGICEIGTYCCAENTCCKEVNELWYFGVGISVIILLIVLAYGLNRYLKTKRAQSYRGYQQVNNEPEETC